MVEPTGLACKDSTTRIRNEDLLTTGMFLRTAESYPIQIGLNQRRYGSCGLAAGAGQVYETIHQTP
jgi:hypothetical protein